MANTVELEQAGIGWISALPWNQAPAELRAKPVEQIPPCSSTQPGVRACAEKMLVHGQEFLCVLKYSACFASEQLHSISTLLAKVMQNYDGGSRLNCPSPARASASAVSATRFTAGFQAPSCASCFTIELEQRDGRWQLTFQLDNDAMQQLVDPSSRTHPAAHQSHGLDSRQTSWPATPASSASNKPSAA